MTDWRNLPAVKPKVKPPKRLRQSLLDRYQRCPRSAYLYLKYDGGGLSPELLRGSAIHLVQERALKEMVAIDEPQIPFELLKQIVKETLAEFPGLPFKEQDRVRVAAYHWAEATIIDPSEIVAIEQRFTLEVAGMIVSGKLDFATISEDRELGYVASIDDTKSTFNLPEQEDYAVRRRDGSLMWVEFQGVCYALLLAHGIPDGGMAPLGERVNLFHVAQVFPAYLYEDPDLHLARRGATIRRDELLDWMDSLEVLVESVKESLATSKWDAIPGSHCNTCPARQECPLPESLRRMHGLIVTDEDAQEAAVQLKFLKDDVATLQREVRKRVDLHGEIAYGDQALRLVPEQREQIKDKDALWEAVARAANTGEPFDPENHIKRSEYNKLKEVTLDPEELQKDEEAA